MICQHCGDEFEEPDLSNSIVASGGWCAPSEVAYDTMPKETLCPDCRSRMMFASEFGFDPGRHGENLRMPRGGIRYEEHT